MNIKRNIPALTAATLAILALAACSQDATVTPAPTAPETTASAPVTSAPAETQAPDATAAPAEFVTGAAVTDQATIDACQPIGIGIVAYGDLTDGKCPLPTGSRLFPMADGSHVVVNQDDPLPEAVTAQVAATAQSSGAMTPAGPASSAATADFLREAAKQTGKSVVVVVKVTYENSGAVRYSGRKPYGESSTMSVNAHEFESVDQAYQDALAFVAAQPDPDRWVVIPYAG